jgi:hypothetical protein
MDDAIAPRSDNDTHALSKSSNSNESDPLSMGDIHRATDYSLSSLAKANLKVAFESWEQPYDPALLKSEFPADAIFLNAFRGLEQLGATSLTSAELAAIPNIAVGWHHNWKDQGFNKGFTAYRESALIPDIKISNEEPLENFHELHTIFFGQHALPGVRAVQYGESGELSLFPRMTALSGLSIEQLSKKEIQDFLSKSIELRTSDIGTVTRETYLKLHSSLAEGNDWLLAHEFIELSYSGLISTPFVGDKVSEHFNQIAAFEPRSAQRDAAARDLMQYLISLSEDTRSISLQGLVAEVQFTQSFHNYVRQTDFQKVSLLERGQTTHNAPILPNDLAIEQFDFCDFHRAYRGMVREGGLWTTSEVRQWLEVWNSAYHELT